VLGLFCIKYPKGARPITDMKRPEKKKKQPKKPLVLKPSEKKRSKSYFSK
jgi:hypothetical protein